jgi:hypothetical protein
VEARADSQKFVSNEIARELPARFARLTGTIAIIFGREPATLAAASPATATTIPIPIPVTIAAAIKTATTAAAARPTAAPATCSFRPSFVHLQSASANFLSIESLHGLGSFRIVGHFNEGKSTSTSRFTVHGNVNSRDLSERFEERAQLRFRRLEIHVPDKHVLHNFLSFKEWESAESAASMPGFSTLCAIVSTG